jgi:3-hydroxymyristoyl/3-hydroxydecanoyl-(acyl carrier protein) dehydratase
MVEPGDTLDLVCEIVAARGPIGKGSGTAHVGGELACSGTLTFYVGDAP